MRVISKARLRTFWEQAGHRDAEGPLQAWHSHVTSKAVTWLAWGDVREEFGSASLVGNCVVFNIGGNKYRLITRILYPSQKIFILKVMSHREYDQDSWKLDCGCYQPPPKSKVKPPRTPDQQSKK